MHGTRQHHDGFSLVELLMVILLMGILASLVLPSLNPTVPEQLAATARIVAADLEYARSLAVANGSRYEIRFEPRENRYVLRHSGANPMLDALPPSPFGSSADGPDRRVCRLDELPTIGPPVRIAGAFLSQSPHSPVSAVEFTSLGGLSAGEPITVWLASGADTARRLIAVEIDPITGRVTVGEMQLHAPSPIEDRFVADGYSP